MAAQRDIKMDVLLPRKALSSVARLRVPGVALRTSDYKSISEGDARIIIIDQRVQTELFDGVAEYGEVLDDALKWALQIGGRVVSFGWDENVGTAYGEDRISPPTHPTLLLPVEVAQSPLDPVQTYRRGKTKFFHGLGAVFEGDLSAGCAFPVGDVRGGRALITVGSARVRCDVLVQDKESGLVLGVDIPYGSGRLVLLPRPAATDHIPAFLKRLVEHLRRRRTAAPAGVDDLKLLRFRQGGAYLCGIRLELSRLPGATLLYYARHAGQAKEYKDALRDGLPKEGFDDNNVFRQYAAQIRAEYDRVLKKVRDPHLPKDGLRFFESLKGGRYVLNLERGAVAVPRSRKPTPTK